MTDYWVSLGLIQMVEYRTLWDESLHISEWDSVIMTFALIDNLDFPTFVKPHVGTFYNRGIGLSYIANNQQYPTSFQDWHLGIKAKVEGLWA